MSDRKEQTVTDHDREYEEYVEAVTGIPALDREELLKNRIANIRRHPQISPDEQDVLDELEWELECEQMRKELLELSKLREAQ